MKILVIEDDADTADYAVQGLREEGHSDHRCDRRGRQTY